MGKIYYSEEFECYILEKECIKDNKYCGVVILKTKGLSKKDIINKLIDRIDNSYEYSEYYKKILNNIIN
jgi:hypothetical protein